MPSLLVYLHKQSERDHRRSSVWLVAKQLANHDHRFGEIGAEQAHRYGEEFLHLASMMESSNHKDRIEIPMIQTEAIPATQDCLNRKRLVVI